MNTMVLILDNGLRNSEKVSLLRKLADDMEEISPQAGWWAEVGGPKTNSAVWFLNANRAPEGRARQRLLDETMRFLEDLSE